MSIYAHSQKVGEVRDLADSKRYSNKSQINIVLQTKNNHEIKEPPKIERSSIQDISSEHSILKEVEAELEKLVGMNDMKKMIKEIYAWLYINKKREMFGLKAGKQALHMMFKGNPGTGKTTVARIIGTLFQKMGVLSKGHLIEAERADLVGEYIGHTAQKTRDLIKKAHGGILFIDEAYSLGRGGEKDFGKEAIDTLVKHMEDKQHEFILILAGYVREMDHFLSLNPGLHSRFPLVFHFKDYSVNQLMEIADRMVEEKDYKLSKEAERKIIEHLTEMKGIHYSSTFSNGRYVRNIIEKSIRAQAMRLLMLDHYDRDDLMYLRSSDIVLKD
ncbi:stage V sporulation protein K [Bacillus coahuilensis]|uniref:stage V sporulation protein K n=1 Tax=Bacillus coahuilensis TaxID=408580 RepID=UPI0009E75DF0